jgi:hypothetical protein
MASTARGGLRGPPAVSELLRARSQRQVARNGSCAGGAESDEVGYFRAWKSGGVEQPSIAIIAGLRSPSQRQIAEFPRAASTAIDGPGTGKAEPQSENQLGHTAPRMGTAVQLAQAVEET